MSKALKKLWEVIKQNEVIKGLLIIAIILPFFWWGFRGLYDFLHYTYYPELEYDSNWLSFFGSYLGGLLGGIATLLAVVETIHSNKEELSRKEEIEKQKEIQKSALIVYYDFRFAFDNIINFIKCYKSEYGTEGIIRSFVDNSVNIDIYAKYINRFDQFYFDSDWIKTVAVLSVSSEFNDDGKSIKSIYEIYGNLMTVKKSVEIINYDTCIAGFRAMHHIIWYKEGVENNGESVIKIQDDIEELMNTLKQLAFEKIALESIL